MAEVEIAKVLLGIKSRYGNMKEYEIAQKLGIKKQDLSAIKHGRKKLSRNQIDKFHATFGVNPKYMLGESDEMWEKQSDAGDVSFSSYQERIEYFENEIKSEFNLTSQKDICALLGIGNENVFSELKSGRRKKLSEKECANLVAVGVNPLFLLGESDILWIPNRRETSINGDNNTNVQGDNNSVNASALLEKAIDEISAQRRLTEQANEIALAAQNLNIETQRQLTAMTEMVKTLTDKGQ